MTALYEIANEYKNAIAVLNDSDFDEETINDTLEAMSGDVEQKCISVASFTKNLDAESEAIKAAIAAMKKRMDSLNNKSNRVKEYLKQNMESTGITNIKCPYFELKIAKNPASVVIDDESLIPDEFKTEETIIKIDKREIKKAKNVPGTHLKTGTRLVIK